MTRLQYISSMTPEEVAAWTQEYRESVLIPTRQHSFWVLQQFGHLDVREIAALFDSSLETTKKAVDLHSEASCSYCRRSKVPA